MLVFIDKGDNDAAMHVMNIEWDYDYEMLALLDEDITMQ